jgi:NAD(P)H-hydrate epimerase
MKVFKTNQITLIDKYTISNEPIKSIDLMERASNVISEKILEIIKNENELVIIAGPGNNGGDGLAIARILYKAGLKVKVFLIDISGKFSEDCLINLERLKLCSEINVLKIKNAEEVFFKTENVIIDALFGSGLARNVDGLAFDVIQKINNSGCKVVSIDIPSGLFGEDNSKNNPEAIVKANYTLSLQFPKLSFFFAENNKYTGKWYVLPIGLNNEVINSEKTNYFFIDNIFAKSILKHRETFSHKGSYGHAILFSGSKGKMGAAILASRACLRSGVGLLTTHVPKCGFEIMQIAVPESITSIDEGENNLSEVPDINDYKAIGVGPGIGTKEETKDFIKLLLENCSKPLVIDADGLNIISKNKELLNLLPVNSILTPHPKEFDRLAGESETTFHRHLKAMNFAEKYSVYIVLKGAYTQVISPDGNCFFNSTGNPGMATGGSGDVLTGIILSFLAQGYSPLNASVLGVFIHGLAGDIVAEENSEESLIASDLIEMLGKAFKQLQL